MIYIRKNWLLLCIIFFTVLLSYTILFPNTVYAMSPDDPNIITDFYGQKEYIGKDAYGYYNSHIPPIPELEGDLQFKQRCVHFCELNAMSMDGTMSTEIYDRELFDARYRGMVDTIENIIHTNVEKTSFFEKIAIVHKQVNDNVVYIYIKATDISKRKIYWTIWEKSRGKYESYNEFKKTWDSSTGFWYKLEKSARGDVKKEIKRLLEYDKLRKEMKKSVKREVEKALSRHNPFII